MEGDGHYLACLMLQRREKAHCGPEQQQIVALYGASPPASLAPSTLHGFVSAVKCSGAVWCGRGWVAFSPPFPPYLLTSPPCPSSAESVLYCLGLTAALFKLAEWCQSGPSEDRQPSTRPYVSRFAPLTQGTTLQFFCTTYKSNKILIFNFFFFHYELFCHFNML